MIIALLKQSDAMVKLGDVRPHKRFAVRGDQGEGSNKSHVGSLAFEARTRSRPQVNCDYVPGRSDRLFLFRGPSTITLNASYA